MLKNKNVLKKVNKKFNEHGFALWEALSLVIVVAVVGVVGYRAISASHAAPFKQSTLRTPLISTPSPVGILGRWNLKFDDEFNNNTLNTTYWNTGWFGTGITQGVNSSELECYDPAQVSISSGVLNLTAKAQQESCGGKTQPYTSGLINTDYKYSFTYGVMEARLWTPAGTGMWPAFWADGQNWPTDGELDVLEAYGTNNSTYHFHWCDTGSAACAPGGGVNVSGATAGWHTYAADWQPGVITWYYDGRAVYQYKSSNVTGSPMYLILNLAVNDVSAQVPNTLHVDYIRVWQ